MSARLITDRGDEALPATAAVDVSIRPFKVDIQEEQLADLRRRIAATRWPEKETVAEQQVLIRRAVEMSPHRQKRLSPLPKDHFVDDREETTRGHPCVDEAA
jgi:hypothetical protein